MSGAADLQSLCERGSERLVATDYVGAERLLAEAEAMALEAGDFDTLSRLYYPLQEARRQIRGKCVEAGVHLVIEGRVPLEAEELARSLPEGSLLVAGAGSTAAGESLRRIYRERGSYAEVILGVTVRAGPDGTVTFATPLPASVPAGIPAAPEDVARRLPAHSVFVGMTSGDAEIAPVARTATGMMSLWEQLHLPFLAAADAMPTSELKLRAYRRAIEVDYACELAHQNAATVARELARPAR